MDKIYFSSSVIALIGLLIILVLLILGKPIPDLIFNIFCGVNIICFISSAIVNRKNITNNKSEKKLEFLKKYTYIYFFLFMLLIVIMLIK